MFGRNRDDRSLNEPQNQNRDRWSSERYSNDRDDRSGQRFTSDDRTYAMNDRSYGEGTRRSEIGYDRGDRASQSYDPENQSPYEAGRFGRSGESRAGYTRDFSPGGTFGDSYSGQPGLNRSGAGSYSSPSSQGYRAYQDYNESIADRSWSPTSNAGSGYRTSSSLDRGYFGKGPKGYKRSDEKIHDEVCELLTSHYDIDASEIEVEVKDGVVTLGGAVESRRVKRLAEDVVADLNGVQDVRNQLRVLSHDSRLLESSSDGKSSAYRSPSNSTDSTLSHRPSSSKNSSSSSTSTTRQ